MVVNQGTLQKGTMDSDDVGDIDNKMLVSSYVLQVFDFMVSLKAALQKNVA